MCSRINVFCVFVYIFVMLWARGYAHNTFASFLKHMPTKLGKALGETWTRVKDVLRREKHRNQRQSDSHNYAEPVKRGGVAVPDHGYTEPPITPATDYMDTLKVLLPVLPTPKSKYRYRWKNIDRTTANELTDVSSIVPPAVLLFLDAAPGAGDNSLDSTDAMKQPSEATAPASTSQVMSFDIGNFKHFRLRVFYQWVLWFL